MPYSKSVSTSARPAVPASNLDSTIESSRKTGLRLWPAKKRPLLSGGIAILVLALVCCVTSATSASAQISLMSASATPAVLDSGNTSPSELGVKFKSDSSGYITGLRFYKATANVGTHVAHIWDMNGILIARAVFTNETASGWQQVNFASPIPVSANTVYVAAYFAPEGHYSINTNYFATAGINNAPLHALEDGVDGPNGVYRHSASSGFPTTGFEASNFWVDVVFSTQATAANPQLKLSATSLSFGSVAVNSAATGYLTLTSSGTTALTVNSAAISGTGFSIVASTLPATLNPGKSLSLELQFKPTAAGADTGKITISSNSTNGSTASVPLSGTGTAAGSPALTLSTSSLSFGSVAVNSAATGTVTLKSSGTTSVTVSSASISGTGFSIVGGAFPVTLSPGQTLAVKLQFLPTAAGSDTGKLTINSNSTAGSSATVALSGTGTAVAKDVDLSWSAPASSADPVAGYNIYRALGSGAFQLVNSSVDTKTSYVDSAVIAGDTYNYIVKSVDESGVESAASNEISVPVP